MALRALLLLGCLIGGWQWTPRTGLSTLQTGRDIGLFRLAGRQLDRSGMAGLRVWADRQHDIGSVGTGPDGKTVEVRFRDGVTGSLLPASRPLRAGRPAQRLHHLDRFRAPGAARALVLEPFATELGLGPTAGDPEVSALQSHGFSVDQLYDAQVTLASMATWHEYNVVYIETHSGVNPGGEGVVASGQVAQDNDPSVTPLLQDGSVILVHVSGTDAVYYGITSVYVRNHEGNFPGSSLIFLNGCRTLLAPIFWDALKSKGAAVMVSWDKEATTKDNYLSAAAFFAEMGKNLSVADAVTAIKQAGYGTSEVNGEQANLSYVGDGSITLATAASPPPPTPTPITTSSVPSVTATSPATVATPRPTATQSGSPSLPVTIRLKPRVAPGTRQVVNVASTPNTILRIRVDFPSGDARTTTTATDGQGQARFAFLQHAGRVAYNAVFATVTVDAVKDSDRGHATQRYRILWSKLDAVVLPRIQAVGKRVMLEAHSAPAANVAFALSFPNGARRLLNGKTGKAGWARVPYRIQRFLKTPSKHRVSVQVTASRGSTTYRTAAAFTIQ